MAFYFTLSCLRSCVLLGCNCMYVYLATNNHPSSDIGSCYDDVDGVYYSLVFEEVFSVSEKAKELEKTIPYDMSFFVTYG